MVRIWPLSVFFLLTSCGDVFVGTKKLHKNDRQIASVTMARLLLEEDYTFEAEISQKLNSLHCYYVISSKYLLQFEERIEDSSLQDLYNGRPYLSLVAAKTQIDNIEGALIELQKSLIGTTKKSILKNQIVKFSQKGVVNLSSVENLAQQFELNLSRKSHYPDEATIKKEYAELDKINEFQIYEKNIEHLAHTMNGSKSSASRLSGQEFRNIDSLDWIPQSPDRIIKRTKELMKKISRDAGSVAKSEMIKSFSKN